MKKACLIAFGIISGLMVGSLEKAWAANVCTDPGLTNVTVKMCCDRDPNIGLNELALKCCVDHQGTLCVKLPGATPILDGSGTMSDTPTLPTATPPSQPPPNPPVPGGTPGVDTTPLPPPVVADPGLPTIPTVPTSPPVISDTPTIPPKPPVTTISCSQDSECAALDTDPNDCQVAQCVPGVATRTGQCILAPVDGCIPTPPSTQVYCAQDSDCASLDTNPNDCQVAVCEQTSGGGVTVRQCVLKPQDSCTPVTGGSDPAPVANGLTCEVSCVNDDCSIALDTNGEGARWRVDYKTPASMTTAVAAKLIQLSGHELIIEGTPASASTAAITTPKTLTQKTFSGSDRPPFLVSSPRPASIRGSFLADFSVRVAILDTAGAALGTADCKNSTAIESMGGGCALTPSAPRANAWVLVTVLMIAALPFAGLRLKAAFLKKKS